MNTASLMEYIDKNSLFPGYRKGLCSNLPQDSDAILVGDGTSTDYLKSLLDDIDNIQKCKDQLREQFERQNLAGESLEINKDDLQEAESSEDRQLFRIMIDASNFLEKEFDVKVRGKKLIVHGKHEVVIDEHGSISREFTRKFDIPENVDMDSFRALFDYYKVLTIEASYKSGGFKESSFDVPIREETDIQTWQPPFRSLGPEFIELAKRHVKDGQELANFATKLGKREFKCIPSHEVKKKPQLKPNI